MAEADLLTAIYKALLEKLRFDHGPPFKGLLQTTREDTPHPWIVAGDSQESLPQH
jgi:hypothetical protein